MHPDGPLHGIHGIIRARTAEGYVPDNLQNVLLRFLWHLETIQDAPGTLQSARVSDLVIIDVVEQRGQLNHLHGCVFLLRQYACRTPDALHVLPPMSGRLAFHNVFYFVLRLRYWVHRGIVEK